MTTLTSARLKLERASEHLKAFHTELSAYIERRPYRVTSELDDDAWQILSFELLYPLPDRLAILAGDACHSLRSALDHIVYAVSEGSDNRSRSYWPIALDKSDYLLPRGKEPCQRPSMRDEALSGVPEPIRLIIDETQPYHGGDRKDIHVLAVIARLDNADKHRLVQTAVGALKDDGWINASAIADEEIEITLTTEWLGIGEPLNVGKKAKILRLRTDPPLSQVNVEYRPRLGVIFGKRGTIDQILGAREVIYRLVERIESTVV